MALQVIFFSNFIGRRKTVDIDEKKGKGNCVDVEMYANQRILDYQESNDMQMANILVVYQMVQIIFLWKRTQKKWQLFDQTFIEKKVQCHTREVLLTSYTIRLHVTNRKQLNLVLSSVHKLFSSCTIRTSKREVKSSCPFLFIARRKRKKEQLYKWGKD